MYKDGLFSHLKAKRCRGSSAKINL